MRNIPMRFRAFNKNLRLFVKAPSREHFPDGTWSDHLEETIQFKNGVFETEDDKQIEWLKKHKLFSEINGIEGMFWVYTDIADVHRAELDALAKQKDDEIAALKLALEEKAKVAPVEPPAMAAPVKKKSPQQAKLDRERERREETVLQIEADPQVTP